MTPTSYFLRICKGQDRPLMLQQLAALGTVHDDPPDGQVMVIINYLNDLRAFQALADEWAKSGKARILDIGG